mmetsp:Transcript_1058/g.2574  ORF Transcript_1058/g.2574 Transcript_1058/m.2574 type:complete len:384 (-) Transcript_1058:161-1312(-)
MRVCRAEQRDAALPCTFHARRTLRHVAIGNAKRASRKVLAHVERRVLVPVAVNTEEVLRRHLAIRTSRKRIRRIISQVMVVSRKIELACEKAVCSPHPSTCVELVVVLAVAVRRGEVEVAVVSGSLWRVPSAGDGVHDKVFRKQEVCRIGEVDVTNDVHVRDNQHVVVGDTLRDPVGTRLRAVRVAGQDVEHPPFVLVVHHQAFAASLDARRRAVVSVVFRELAHQLNCTPRSVASFHGDAAEFVDAEHCLASRPPRRRHSDAGGASAFAHAKLFFVHDAVVGIVVCVRAIDLFNGADGRGWFVLCVPRLRRLVRLSVSASDEPRERLDIRPYVAKVLLTVRVSPRVRRLGWKLLGVHPNDTRVRVTFSVVGVTRHDRSVLCS